MCLSSRARLAAVMVALALLASCGSPITPTAPTGASPSTGASASATPDAGGASGTPPPAPGHELYGFVPYWEMDDTIVAHLAATPLSTVALFSVTTTSRGVISKSQTGYKRIAGPIGAAMIATAHRRGVRVELVFTSFGAARNASFFGSPTVQTAAIQSLVDLVAKLGVDGVDVDVEGLDIDLAPTYGAFVGQLRAAVVAADPAHTVSVATSGGPTGAAMAAAAAGAGADRVFLMGYDYRTAGSSPGATSPVVRADGGRSLTWSLDLYSMVGVPPQRLLLGLPLYGMSWPVAGPVIGAPATGSGSVWILRQHLDVMTNSAAVPQRDPVEVVDVYFLGSDRSLAAPSGAAATSAALGSASPGASALPTLSSPPASAAPSSSGPSWTAAYVDSPDTLAAKLGLGESRGLAGAGFWAIGYERGLPAYTDLMTRFVAGEVPPS